MKTVSVASTSGAKIRSIQFEGTMKGKGIINFDSPSQSYTFKQYRKTWYDCLDNKNVKLAKHHYYGTPKKVNGDEEKSDCRSPVSDSADALRHYIFENDIPFQNPNVQFSDHLMYMLVGSVPMQLRGYMFASHNPPIKRKSGICITDAEQISDAMSSIEAGSSSGPKGSSDGTIKKPGDSGELSLYYRETIGEAVYAFSGAVDIRELQFISTSQVFDRQAINPDKENIFRTNLGNQFGSEVPGIKYYQVIDSAMQVPEQGILLTEDQINFMVKYFFRRLLGYNVQKAKAYRKLDTLKIRLITDPLDPQTEPEIILRNETGLVGEPVFNSKEFEIFYKDISDDQAKGFFSEMVVKKEIHDKSQQAKKEAKKLVKEEAKNKREMEKNKKA